MKQQIKLLTFAIFLITSLSACSSQATPAPTVDVISTIAMQLASQMQTQTVAAYSPTPLPSTTTPTPSVTDTATPTAEYVATRRPEVIGRSPCYTGPGPTYALTSNISDTKKVELLGIGSVPGWYIIKNPYFNSPCWISEEDLKIFSDIDLSTFPTITP